MRSPARLLTLSSLSSLWLVGCGGSPHRELQVMSYTPQGSVDHAGASGALRVHHRRRRARLSMQRGIFALEAAAKGYPVWSRNVGKLAIECAAIPRGKLVQLLTTDMNYDPWGGNNDDKPLGWAAFGVTSKTATRTIAGRNQWQLSELDLGATCAGRPGARGVYLAEVTSHEIVPDPQRSWLPPRRNRVLANVTDLGVLLEVGTSSRLVWVTALSTGAPLAGAKVSVFTPAGK